jgi:rsbT co-antagonist protein RsbR
LETIERHQQAIRELSTPVIRVHDGVLLLPLVGAIDSLQAHQVMEHGSKSPQRWCAWATP